MGMLSSAGAESAAREILAMIARKRQEYEQEPKVIEVLAEIEQEAERIRIEAEGGWY